VHSRPSERRSLNLLRAVLAWTAREVSVLDPGCFAIVMATGITSNAMFAERQRGLSDALFRVTLFVYPWLVLATILRMTDFRAALWSDLANPRLVFSFFTFVAASDVLGVQIALRGFVTIPLLLWLSALAAFAILTYFSSGLLIFRNAACGADLVVRGGGLLAIVGTQSLVLLGAPVAASTISEHGNAIVVLIHALWGIGLVLYGIFVTHFACRISYMRVEPQDLTPLLWVVRGRPRSAQMPGLRWSKTGRNRIPSTPCDRSSTAPALPFGHGGHGGFRSSLCSAFGNMVYAAFR
jgi:hypothetical protein